jgi:hypothetical protein
MTITTSRHARNTAAALTAAAVLATSTSITWLADGEPAEPALRVGATPSHQTAGPDDAPPARAILHDLATRVAALPKPAREKHEHVIIREWASDTIVRDQIATATIRLIDVSTWRPTTPASPSPSPGPATPLRAGPAEGQVYAAGELHSVIAQPISTDPAILAGQFNFHEPLSNGPQALLRTAAALHRGQYPTNAQWAAALTVLANHDGPVYRGTIVDRTGRPGVAITVDSNNSATRDLLILDPQTGRPLAAEMTFLRVGRQHHVTVPWTDNSILYLTTDTRAQIDESSVLTAA